MVTIKDIAQAADVSPSTVSRALNGSPLLREETKARIRATARELGYERNELAVGLVKGVSRVIGLVVPDISNPFFGEIARGVSNVAHSAGYGVVLSNTEGDTERERDYVNLLRRRRVDGLVLASVKADDPYVLELARSQTPYVLVSRLSGLIDAPFVVVDDRQGGRLAVEHLVSLGHTRIGFIGGPSDVQSSRDRMEATRETLKEYGAPTEQAWFCYANFTQQAGYEAAGAILSRQRRPTALFAANDMIALGVMQAADELGFRIPDDLSLVGFNDIAYASFPRIQLTTVAQPTNEMGRIAAEYLLAVVQRDRRAKLRRSVQPRLVVRKTTGPPGGRSTVLQGDPQAAERAVRRDSR